MFMENMEYMIPPNDVKETHYRTINLVDLVFIICIVWRNRWPSVHHKCIPSLDDMNALYVRCKNILFLVASIFFKS